MEVEQCSESLCIPDILAALFDECSAVTDYRTLRDSLPKRLAHLLRCRCVLFYQRTGETLQFASGTFDDKPGWSAALLSVVHINPVSLNSNVAEAQAWRERHVIPVPASSPTLIAAPLIYRQRSIGVLVAIRSGLPSNDQKKSHFPQVWGHEEVQAVAVVANVVALLLENTRLLERDRERIHELSLLNSISSQMNYSLYEAERVRSIIIQRVREISRVDLCDTIEPTTPQDAISWLPQTLREMLFSHFNEQHSRLPLILERPGDTKNPYSVDYLQHLPATIKTFFAFPLLGGRAFSGRGNILPRTVHGRHSSEPKILGIVVGAYHRARKVRREESMLLQVVVSQASAVLENMQLVTEVMEARNEARKLLRQVLEDQRLKELILESMPSGLITVDMQGCITTFNHAAQTILGYHPGEVLGHSLSTLLNACSSPASNGGSHFFLNSASSPLPQDALQHVIAMGEAQSGTLITADQQGHEVVLDVDLLPLRDDRGEQVGALTTFIDVTSVHRLEEEKRRLDRLASLGEMAANVAHEVRNPLASIKTSIQILMDDLTEGVGIDVIESGQEGQNTRIDWAQESTTIMLKEVERLDSIVHDLLLFAKPRQLHYVKCNLVELSDHVLQLMQTQCAEANVVVKRIYDVVSPLWIDMGQIEQVLFNLYMNALQAMPEGGVLTIACHIVKVDDEAHRHEALPTSARKPQKKHETSSQQRLELQVADTGVGIEPDQLERIFQPFFTTKAHGIGLGLPITRRLVEDHGGSLSVESRLGYGTTISVQFPLINTAHAQEEEGEGLRDE